MYMHELSYFVYVLNMYAFKYMIDAIKWNTKAVLWGFWYGLEVYNVSFQSDVAFHKFMYLLVRPGSTFYRNIDDHDVVQLCIDFL